MLLLSQWPELVRTSLPLSLYARSALMARKWAYMMLHLIGWLGYGRTKSDTCWSLHTVSASSEAAEEEEEEGGGWAVLGASHDTIEVARICAFGRYLEGTLCLIERADSSSYIFKGSTAVISTTTFLHRNYPRTDFVEVELFIIVLPLPFCEWLIRHRHHLNHHHDIRTLVSSPTRGWPGQCPLG